MNFNNQGEKSLQRPKMDLVNFEMKQRQFMNELAIKRTRVEEQKTEIEAANLKIHQLTRSLEVSETKMKDFQYKFDSVLKKSRFLEHNLSAKRDAFLTSNIQQASLIAEKDTLNELLEKTNVEKYELIRQVNELKAQHDCDVAYQKELLNFNATVRPKIAQLTELVQNFQTDQKTLHELSIKMETCEELEKSVEFYRDQYYKGKDKLFNIENKYIKVNAALETFESLAKNEATTVKDETEIVIQQWEKSTKRFRQHIQTQNRAIENFNVALKTQKEVNTKLCLSQAELENKNAEFLKEIEELKLKLTNALRKNSADDEIQTSVLVTIQS